MPRVNTVCLNFILLLQESSSFKRLYLRPIRMTINDSSTNPCSHLDLTACNIDVLLWKICGPIFLPVGITGNVCSFVIWCKKRMCRTTTSVYVRFLAVVDTLVLIVGVLRELIVYTSNFDIQVLSTFSCRLHNWLAFSVTGLSAWILSALVVDRLVIVKFPQWTQIQCSNQSAVIIGTVLVVVIITVL